MASLPRFQAIFWRAAGGRNVFLHVSIEISPACHCKHSFLLAFPCPEPGLQVQGSIKNDVLADNPETRAQWHASHWKAASRQLCGGAAELGPHAGRIPVFFLCRRLACID